MRSKRPKDRAAARQASRPTAADPRFLPRAGLLIAIVAALVAAAAPAAAVPYSNPGSHYAFDYPTGWTASGIPNVDAAILGPSAGGFRPNIVAQHEDEPASKNDSLWLLEYVKNSLAALKAQQAVTEVQAPRTFTTGSGRLAGDYVVEKVSGNFTLRQRQVFFVSEFHDLAFYLTFTDRTVSYSSHASDWNRAVDSFAVMDEPSGFLSGVTLYAVVGAAAGAGAVGALAVRRRRKKARALKGAAPP